jgi:2-polyprenyl-3-methyl-5-hydroxy-6-metoxy-1,4-benzoquinol methylase
MRASIEESIPPERKAPNGTSLVMRIRTASSMTVEQCCDRICGSGRSSAASASGWNGILMLSRSGDGSEHQFSVHKQRITCSYFYEKRGVSTEAAMARRNVWAHGTQLAPAIRYERLPTAGHAETVSYFDRQAAKWTQHYDQDRYFQKRLETILRWISDHPPGLRILDYGCGSGVFLKRLIDAGHVVTGVDASPEMLASAQKTLERAAVPKDRFVLEQVQGNCGGNFLEHSYDGILSLGVLEYLENPIALLEQLVHRLSPGSFLILSLPNQPSLLRSVERIVKPSVLRTVERVGLLQFLFPRLLGPDVCFKYQKYQFNLTELERFLAAYGLKRRRVYYHGAPRLLGVVEKYRAIGDTVIAEFKRVL